MARKTRGGGSRSSGSKNGHTGYRSAKTGRFVTKRYANRNPAKTVKESIPNPGRGDT